MIRDPAHGALRGRVLAARCLEIAVRGMPPSDRSRALRADAAGAAAAAAPSRAARVGARGARARAPDRVDAAARGHGARLGPQRQPAPPPARAHGVRVDARRAPRDARGAARGDHRVERRERLGARRDRRGDAVSLLRAQGFLGPPREAHPRSRRTRSRRARSRVVSRRSGGAGCATRRSTSRSARCARRARGERPTALDDARRWIEVIGVTDIVDDAERDPLDVELGLENLMRDRRAVRRRGGRRALRRASRTRSSPSFQESRKIALGTGELRQRAAAFNTLEGTARAFALRLWSPLLATRPAADPIEQPNLEEMWKLLAAAPNGDPRPRQGAPRGRGRSSTWTTSCPLEVLAIRLGGYALDACGEDSELGRGRGPTAHATCLWLRKVEGLADGSRDMTPPLESAL